MSFQRWGGWNRDVAVAGGWQIGFVWFIFFLILTAVIAHVVAYAIGTNNGLTIWTIITAAIANGAVADRAPGATTNAEVPITMWAHGHAVGAIHLIAPAAVAPIIFIHARATFVAG